MLILLQLVVCASRILLSDVKSNEGILPVALKVLYIQNMYLEFVKLARINSL